MDNQTKTISSIAVFHAPDGGKWIPLPETSQYLTDRQIFPDVNDGLTLAGNDRVLIGLQPTDFEHIQTVTRRWFNYYNADVALFVDYKAW